MSLYQVTPETHQTQKVAQEATCSWRCNPVPPAPRTLLPVTADGSAFLSVLGWDGVIIHVNHLVSEPLGHLEQDTLLECQQGFLSNWGFVGPHFLVFLFGNSCLQTWKSDSGSSNEVLLAVHIYKTESNSIRLLYLFQTFISGSYEVLFLLNIFFFCVFWAGGQGIWRVSPFLPLSPSRALLWRWGQGGADPAALMTVKGLMA